MYAKKDIDCVFKVFQVPFDASYSVLEFCRSPLGFWAVNYRCTSYFLPAKIQTASLVQRTEHLTRINNKSYI